MLHDKTYYTSQQNSLSQVDRYTAKWWQDDIGCGHIGDEVADEDGDNAHGEGDEEEWDALETSKGKSDLMG